MASTTWPAARVQVRVLRALMLREIIARYGRDNIGFLWQFVEPMILCVGVMIVWTALRMHHHQGVTLVAFVLTGYMPLTLWRHMCNNGMKLLRRNVSLLYHRRITPLDILLAKMALEFLSTTLAFAFIATVLVAFDAIEPPSDLRPVLAGWLLMGWFSFGAGALVAALSEWSELTDKFYPPLQYLLLPLCGVFFMLEWLPSRARDFFYWVPLVHSYELIREGFVGENIRTYGDPWYLTIWCVLLTGLGLWALGRASRELTLQ